MSLFSRINMYFKSKKCVQRDGRTEYPRFGISLMIICQIKAVLFIKLCICWWLDGHRPSWTPNTDSDWCILPHVYSYQFENMWYLINELNMFSFFKRNYSFQNEYVQIFIFESCIFNSVYFEKKFLKIQHTKYLS